MAVNLSPNIPNLVMLVQPNHFGYNLETADSNVFQQVDSVPGLKDQVQVVFRKVVEILQEQGVSCKVFPDGEVPLPDAVFPNNWIALLPSGELTIFPMYAENRRAEVRSDVIEWLMENTLATELIDLRAEVQKNRFLEGTGSIVFDHSNRLAYACESSRTSVALFESYCNIINYKPMSFESLDLTGFPIYHTNVMMSIAEQYCLINLDSIHNTLERSFCKLALEKSGKEIIPISYEQMNAFAANVLEVKNEQNESCLIMSKTAYGSLTLVQIEQISRFSKIIQVDVSIIEKIGGGGIRCMLAGMFIR